MRPGWIQRVRMVPEVARVLFQLAEEEDLWASRPCQAPLHLLWEGCRHDLDWYLAGESRIRVHAVADICRWLHGCQYLSGQALFREPDFWQHPVTFEQIRRGDCEDHALWAWRRLLDLGLPAELCVGHRLGTDGTAGGHAWTVFREGETEYLLESVAKYRRGTLQPLASVRHAYVPYLSLGGDRGLKLYRGYLEQRSVGQRRDPGPVP
jgi:hypothetical protein